MWALVIKVQVFVYACLYSICARVVDYCQIPLIAHGMLLYKIMAYLLYSNAYHLLYVYVKSSCVFRRALGSRGGKSVWDFAAGFGFRIMNLRYESEMES